MALSLPGVGVGEGATATDVTGMLRVLNSRVAFLLTIYGVAMGIGAGAVTVVGRVLEAGGLDDGGMVRGTVMRMVKAEGNVEFPVCMFLGSVVSISNRIQPTKQLTPR
jgi:hypothetical protein